MSSAIAKAFARLESLRANAKAAIVAPALSAIQSGGTIGETRPAPSGARELCDHNKGWVFAAVRLIATRVAGQAINVGYRAGSLPVRKGGNAVEPLSSHRLLNVLSDPSDLHTQWTLMFCTVASLELTGRALWWVTSENGQDRIFHLPTHWIESTDRRRTVWNIRPDGSTRSFPIPGEQIAHYFYPDPCDPFGCISTLQRIADAVLADESIGTAQRAAFENGLLPGLILHAGRLPTDPVTGEQGERPILESWQRRELVSAIRNMHRGAMNAGEPLILDGLIDNITKLTSSVAEMDFLNSSKLTKAKILQGFGVSPILLGEVEGANRASATVADEIFVSNKVNPLLTLLSQAMTEWLGPLFAPDDKRLTVWIEPAVAHDPELSLKRWQSAAQLGYVTPNEYRRNVLSLPNIDGGDELREALEPMKGFDPYTLASLSN
ncbi:Phage portal protein [Anatilimnocola aggregata]|uniref:Phage portal protein n=1 Tax=Anatilimnocola aggregata TaxID=2528021 RepID=A0A517YK61_9BACT|nr:phage portal protein [Anatilimnocola aggregata]QDU30596.1 Phage portal protein [Anatilimnocola aggregata]